jgi:hypothetical protein
MQGHREIARRLESPGRHPIDAPRQDRAQLGRHERIESCQRRDGVAQEPCDDFLRRGAREKRLAAQHLVQDAAQSEDVAAGVHRSAHDLLG